MTTKYTESPLNLTWTVFVLGMLITAVVSCQGTVDSSHVTTNAVPVNRSSVEHKYATERFKREGLSQKDAQTAADAVLKFHNAQKNK